jgi:hypothetical protein
MTAVESGRTLIAPPRNMVQEVRNIIEGYSMGAVRALAQEPVQNAIDARRAGASIVRVEYRLIRQELEDGREVNLLTVTDSGTTGLRGPVLAPDDLFARETVGLLPEENWAAWEAMGYTKIGEDALGSRGQGKAAFLYHSRHESDLTMQDGRPLERMIIFYDTLLEDGTYRLGARLGRPGDVIVSPPFEGDEARELIAGTWRDYDEVVPLGLAPLADVGTRIIVPFLSEEALEAFQDGELAAWLERCWWRAVQTRAVEIKLVDAEGGETTIGVPAWWSDEPWAKKPFPEGIFVKENIPIAPGDPLKIKRIVLLHKEDLAFDEIPGWPLQYSGVQLLRGRQWIETLTASEKFGDFIPPVERDGFRGFVEFDRYLDRELREVEKPQHDGFKRRKVFVGQIDAQIKEAVKEFAEGQGWISDKAAAEPEDEKTAEDVLRRVSELFVSEGTGGDTGRETRWTCELSVDLPHAAIARVDYGETIANVSIACTHDPAGERKDVEFSLELVTPDGHSVELVRRSGKTSGGSTGADLGDFTVVHTASGRGRELACPIRDRNRLRARCFFDGEIVASATRSFYVASDPPPREARPFGVTLTVRNTSADRTRINDGERIEIVATVANRSGETGDVTVNLSLGDLMLADETELVVPGRPLGDLPGTADLVYRDVTVLTAPPADEPDRPFVVLEPGVHRVSVDVKDLEGDVVAYAGKMIHVEVDPDRGGADMPFQVRAREDLPYPIWELTPPAGADGSWILLYAPRHPTFEETKNDGRAALDRFWAETFCGALVEWALRLERDAGDGSGFALLTQTGQNGSPLWERYDNRLQELINTYEDPLQCLALQREVVSLMLCLLSEN